MTWTRIMEMEQKDINEKIKKVRTDRFLDEALKTRKEIIQ